MIALLNFLLRLLFSPFKSIRQLEAENAALRQQLTIACTENSVRIDLVTESPNVSDDGRAVILLPGAVRLAVQVEEPT